jgi:hypothetical protein
MSKADELDIGCSALRPARAREHLDATATQSSAANLEAATKALASVALNLAKASANAATSLSPDNLYLKSTQGLRSSVARK